MHAPLFVIGLPAEKDPVPAAPQGAYRPGRAPQAVVGVHVRVAAVRHRGQLPQPVAGAVVEPAPRLLRFVGGGVIVRRIVTARGEPAQAVVGQYLVVAPRIGLLLQLVKAVPGVRPRPPVRVRQAGAAPACVVTHAHRDRTCPRARGGGAYHLAPGVVAVGHRGAQVVRRLYHLAQGVAGLCLALALAVGGGRHPAGITYGDETVGAAGLIIRASRMA